MTSLSLLREKCFKLSGTTSASAYKAEIALVRLEDQIVASSMSASLFQASARLEAISTVRIDGLAPSLSDLTLMDAVDENFTEQIFGPAVIKSSFCTRNASVEAFLYLQTLRWISETVHPGFIFTPTFVLDVHSRCLYGKNSSETGIRFRRATFLNDPITSGQLPYDLPYNLPNEDELPRYIEDLCDFMNGERFSPIAQAGFMHFQFERIRPFKTGLDRTGRALCHALFFSRGLVRKFIPPIALLPAINTSYHAVHLFPHMSKQAIGHEDIPNDIANDIDIWTKYCAQSTEVAADVALRYINAFEQLETRWSEQVGKVSKGSAVERLLMLLPGYPFITVDFARHLTGKGFSATNDAISRLVDCKILNAVGSKCSSSRLFKASGALDLATKINDTLLNEDPVSRASNPGF
ncbi:MAG: Fic family protein [Eggerthellaceae bacterium]|nr:Fic family protein [Eggerthellaceae bacterium]